jgi:hypothetical protein
MQNLQQVHARYMCGSSLFAKTQLLHPTPPSQCGKSSPSSLINHTFSTAAFKINLMKSQCRKSSPSRHIHHNLNTAALEINFVNFHKPSIARVELRTINSKNLERLPRRGIALPYTDCSKDRDRNKYAEVGISFSSSTATDG